MLLKQMYIHWSFKYEKAFESNTSKPQFPTLVARSIRKSKNHVADLAVVHC